MSPAEFDKSRPRRIVVLPLPVWRLWALAEAVRSVVMLLCRLVNVALASRHDAQTSQVAAGHQDRRCRQVAEQVFEHLNAYRQAKGLRPLRWNARLEASSLYQSNRMSELGEFAHVLSDGVELNERVERFGYRYRSCGENLFWLLAPTKGMAELAWAMHDGWVHSPGHEANLVGDWVEVGVGVVPDGEGGYYATQNFGRPATPF
ncbi:CAP domain-containing protein [Botrimarina mediterranea]|uniref:Cysteine-rich secretory protein family protein n=1 Tax=Botrimarina mediterranea TaxID=2528022 RepID=A0A518K9U0_9BACT|nr:CAP domain-containing protein [Botrimarina mediterranea]QDV74550.1 Cysteine-rich secretory protein family protein [Botrimarina mediterranea]QDV79190.1 Cysteine-rich secretory protein family protein [Planctomycetes bacterium K2D]